MRRGVIAGVVAVFALWLLANLQRVLAAENGVIQLVLATLFAVLLLLRWKPERQAAVRPSRLIAAAALVGAPLFLVGLLFRVHQFEWLGLLLLFYAALAWAMRPDAGVDVGLAMLVLYWAHPIPGKLVTAAHFVLQKMSVAGAERLLHALNVRAWADSLVIYAGASVYGVPESCSGLRTAVTVFLCAVGVGLLFRFTWRALLSLVAVGMAQVLALNVIRVAGTIWWAPRMPPDWGERALHDTLGILLLICIALVMAEALWWKIRRDARQQVADGVASGVFEPPERATILPRFWKLFNRWWLRVSVALLTVLLLAAFAYKQRPSHRAVMISGVVDNLVENNPEVAIRAVGAALVLAPGDRAIMTRKLQAMVGRGLFPEALRYAESLRLPLSPFETVLKSRALLGVGRSDEAVALLDALPANMGEIPGVAMIRAEYSALRNEPERVARFVVLASRSHREVPRVRRLFLYLAAHEQWGAIARSDRDLPYRAAGEAVIATEAGLRVNDLSMAGRAMRRALVQWPGDVLLLNGLAELASRTPGGEWEADFGANLEANLHRLSADQLVRYLDLSVDIGRPDLVWLTYARLRKVDPTDPVIHMAPAQFGGAWLTFRCHQLGIPAAHGRLKIDLGPVCRLTRHFEPFRELWDRVPLLDNLTGPGAAGFRQESLKSALREFESREKAGKLTRRLRLTYPVALALDGRFDEAHAKLDQILRDEPALAGQVALLHAILYDQQGLWEAAYEALQPLDQASNALPSLTGEMIRINALMRMGMPVAALSVANRARQWFPHAPQVMLAEAGIWDSFGQPELALRALEGGDDERCLRFAASLLRETGRYEAANRLGRGLGLVDDPVRRAEQQPFILEPAEWSLAPRFGVALTDAQIAEQIGKFESGIAKARSPFIRSLGRLELEWLRARGRGAASDPARWAAVGRSQAESAAAVHRLVLQLARDGRLPEALNAVNVAVGIAPQSPVLRRIQIVLSAKRETIEAAREVCPWDPEVWLAWFVARFREEGAGEWIPAVVRQAVAARVSASTLVRAGDFLLRNKASKEATLVAREAIARADGLLAAYVLGLNCALVLRDPQWALDCALQGVDRAADPIPFYRVIVMLKASKSATDADMVRALEFLRSRFPAEIRWAEGLGVVSFERGDTRRAFRVLGEIVDDHMKQMRVRSLLLAAESARVEGDLGRAIGILEAAYGLYPTEVSVLNNLIYTLTANETGRERASELISRLLERGKERYEVHDTAAVVYLRLGRIEDARREVEEALRRCDEKSYGAGEVHLNAAEIYLQLGQVEQARQQVEIVLKRTDRSVFLDRRAGDLMRRIREAEKRKGSNP